MMRSVVLVAGVLLLAGSALAGTEGANRTITVNGQAEVKVAPDRAVVSLGVEIFEAELPAAKQRADGAIASVLDAARRNGVPDEHLKTDYLNVRPWYRGAREERALQGYVVRQSVVVEVTDLDRLEDVVSAALEAGANEIHGISFHTSDFRTHQDEARSLALDAAKQKAKAMAGRLGEQVGRPVRITEGSAASPAPLAANVMRTSESAAWSGAGTLVAGRITVTATVSVTFELGDPKEGQ